MYNKISVRSNYFINKNVDDSRIILLLKINMLVRKLIVKEEKIL